LEAARPQTGREAEAGRDPFPASKDGESQKDQGEQARSRLESAVAVDLNVKHLAVITVRQQGKIIETVFTSDQGLDAHRYRHMKRIAQKQWQSGKAVKGERSNQQIWSHVKRMNDSVAQEAGTPDRLDLPEVSWLCADF